MCPMKQFFKLTNILNIIIQFLFTFSLFCCSSVGFSSITRSNCWSEAETVSRYMSAYNESHVLMLSRSASYPSFVNSARNYLGYEIIKAYTNNQESFVCSSPDKTSTPVIVKGTNLSPHFICLNGYGGNKESFVTRYGELLYGNNIKSADLGTDTIYVSQSIADKVMQQQRLIQGDYQSFMKKGLNVLLLKDGAYIKKTLKIADIVVGYKNQWMNSIYGENIIFGGFYCAETVIVDNLMVHSVLEDDIYSNAYFFSKAKPLLEKKCSYLCEYGLVQNGLIIQNETLNSMIERSKTSGRITEVIFGVIFLSLTAAIAASTIAFRKRILFRYIRLSKSSFLTLSLSFCSSMLFCSKINLFQANRVSLFSPYGFIFMLAFYLVIVALILYFLKNRRINQINKNYYEISI